MKVHLDGRLVPQERARISVFDRGLLFGDAVFESMRVYGGRIFRLDRHLDRLARSAAAAGLPPIPDAAVLRREADELLAAEGLADARLRLTITAGAGRPGDYLAADGPATRILAAAPYAGLDPGLYRDGVALVVPERRAVPAEALDPAIKSTSRLASVLARREARARGAFEAVLRDAGGFLSEGTASNVFLVTAGAIHTPAAPAAALPGVTREAVLEVARAAGYPIREEPIPAAQLAAAEEVFLTNTSWEVLPVTRVDGRAVGQGVPGRVVRDLLTRFRALVRRECLDA